jgi:L-arabinose isomerase
VLNLADNEVWLVTGSQHLYGPETLETVAEHSRAIATALDEAPSIPVRVVFKPVLTGSDGIKRLIVAQREVLGAFADEVGHPQPDIANGEPQPETGGEPQGR